MRDLSRWRSNLAGQLRQVWPTGAALSAPSMLDVELGLYLMCTTAPGYRAADAWTLFGGYPYGEAFSAAHGSEQKLRIRRGRHYLLKLRRPREWADAVRNYMRLPAELRGYELDHPDQKPVRREVSSATSRFAVYERVLTTPPEFAKRKLAVAGTGGHRFTAANSTHAVTFDQDLIDTARGIGAHVPHDLNAALPRNGAPTVATMDQLRQTAERMDAQESEGLKAFRGSWARRLDRVELHLRDEEARRFVQGDVLTISGLCHLVGMVGAGKTTLRDILTFWATTEEKCRVTLVVSDVAEVLHTVDRFARLGVSAAPVLGQTTRDRHLHRLHRRVANAGAASLLDHQDPAFDHLSTACPVDALRGLDGRTPIATGDAPCQNLFPVAGTIPVLEEAKAFASQDEDQQPVVSSRRKDRPQPRSCPLWQACPRHHGSRELATAQVWVTTPAGLVHSGVPNQMNPERLRYFELAARRSDLIIVDEADRVQMQLDTAFAPSATLSGRSPNSWLDEVARHKLDELAGEGRLQLSERDVKDWNTALNTVTAATDHCYSLLVDNAALREWITQDYFSAFTLHQRLISSWFPDVAAADAADLPSWIPPERLAEMERVSAVLSRFRDAPLREQPPTGPDDFLVDQVNRLTRLTLELLHAEHSSGTRTRLLDVLTGLLGDDAPDVDVVGIHVLQFEFTLLLAALHHRLNTMTTLWPRVEAALNLHGTSNVLSRRPPRDYEPILPESPMGNVLGFQFKLDERTREGGNRSGELRFFRCGGVGRELLTALPHVPEIDDRPGPNVLLMSGTSWAGTSTRYHIHEPVNVVLRPHRDEVAAITQTRFRKLSLYWPGTEIPLRLSGNPTPQQRAAHLEQMLRQIAVPDRSLPGEPVSDLHDELSDLPEDRRRVLMLVGSYDEARRATEYLNGIPEWRGKAIRLVSDDTDLDDAWMTLRRGDVARFPVSDAQILVAPLLAVERGHNIVLPDGQAAIGTAYFLARPHPRPDDISLAVQAIHDWAVRQIRGVDPAFLKDAIEAGNPDLAGLRFRTRARKQWNRLLTRRLSWTSLPSAEKTSFTWDQLVVIWQVIGRLVRGGVPARAVFVDAAFFPEEAKQYTDTARTSLIIAMREVLRPYLTDDPAIDPIDRSLVRSLYEPLYEALDHLD